MKILIADDEPLARERLTRLLKHIPDCTVLQPDAENGYDTLQLVQRLKPDILLLDIGLPGLDGLQVAAQLCAQNDAPAVIFCLAQHEYATQAFDLSATSYLLKPIYTEQLQTALVQAQYLTPLQLATLSRAPRTLGAARSHLSARTHKGIELIPLAQVTHCIADNKYVTLRHTEGETLLDESLKSLEEEFADILCVFIATHWSAATILNAYSVRPADTTNCTCVMYQKHLASAAATLLACVN